MIANLTGTILSKTPNACVIDVGGVGYSVLISLTTFASLSETGASAAMHIHTHVREDALLLYGFSTREEKALFQRLITISGVGPKTALAMLSGLSTGQLIDAIKNENRAMLSTIPGIGRKTAERIIVELKDRLAKEFAGMDSSAAAPKGQIHEDAVSALVNLGYGRPAAEGALRKIGPIDNASIEDLIRSALKELCRT